MQLLAANSVHLLYCDGSQPHAGVLRVCWFSRSARVQKTISQGKEKHTQTQDSEGPKILAEEAGCDTLGPFCNSALPIPFWRVARSLNGYNCYIWSLPTKLTASLLLATVSSLDSIARVQFSRAHMDHSSPPPLPRTQTINTGT